MEPAEPVEPLHYIYSESMFLAETKGLTHWFLFYDEEHVHVWNIVRNVYQLLFPYLGVVALAVDPLRGCIFVATNETIVQIGFSVNLGEDMMNPTVKLTSLPVTIFVNEGIRSMTVDPDVSVLYISAEQEIIILFYSPDAVRNNGGYKQ